MKKLVALLVAFSSLVACTEESKQALEPINTEKNNWFEENQDAYLALGDSISSITQQVLMGNVQAAIKRGGFVEAVNFCNLNANGLADSMGQIYHASIQRLSEKNRNLSNGFSTDFDKKALEEIKKINADQNEEKKHIVVQDGDAVYYYKTIKTFLPTCIQCHGDKEKDIQPDVLKTIMDRYPNDKATGYHLNDFRGVWKIKLSKLEQ